MNWLSLVSMFAPLALTFVPGGAALAPFVPTIVHGIAEAQSIPGASGQEKKAHVLNLVSTAVAAANATGKVTLDHEATLATASAAIDTTIGVLNVVHAAHQAAA